MHIVRLEAGYRLSICDFKENDMTRFAQNSLAAFAAVFLAFSSIGTIVTVRDASAHTAYPAAPFSQPISELA